MSLDDNAVEYKCSRCGACCKWPGDVCIEQDEVGRIARYLEISEDEFIHIYCGLRKNRQGLTIIENGEGACMMLKNNACRINPVKPRQCLGFPNKWNFPGWRDICKAQVINK